MERIKKIELYPSTRIQAGGTVYSPWVPVTNLNNLLAFIKLTAQGNYADETLNISVQTKAPSGDAVDLVEDGSAVALTEIGNKTASLPFLDYLGFTNFGAEIRFKIVTTGTAVDYTFGLDGIAKDL